MQITEAEQERRIDRAVMRRLNTDSAYRNAENAEDQAAREQQITDEEVSKASVYSRHGCPRNYR